MNYDDFFAFAAERERIRVQKEAMAPRPWTEDPILQDGYFTNVHREDDKTTVWFRENVRRDYQTRPEVIPATMLFRWFNRIDIGETIFCMPTLLEHHTIFEQYLKDTDIDDMRRSIKNVHPKGPYVNGAYIIKAHNGMDKLSGVLRAFHEAMGYLDAKYTGIGDGYTFFAEDILQHQSMEWTTRELAKINYLGMFMAYEIVCDLRYTLYLEGATDKRTWANPGPGAKRGILRLATGYPEGKANTQYCIDVMRDILANAPPDWEMREVEHTLCEFDKYRRIAEGGRGKRRYKR